MMIALLCALAGFLTGCTLLSIFLWQSRSAARKSAIEQAAEQMATEARAEAALGRSMVLKTQLEEHIAEQATRLSRLEAESERLVALNNRLARWSSVADADDKAHEMIASAQQILAQAESDARILQSNAERQHREAVEHATAEAEELLDSSKAKAQRLIDDAQSGLAVATSRSTQILVEAHQKALEIGGQAYEALQKAAMYERTVTAMKNIIEGYGEEYLTPSTSLLDDLAEHFQHSQAGQALKLAREHTKMLIKNRCAAMCDYVETNRREGAEHFVIDAFNGKVDSILSRVKHDNAGKLEQEIRDAFYLVNFNGQPFRNARITDQYLDARLQELRWAATAQELRRQEQEEQRRVREQIREEERARREYERAVRETAREEEVLREAMNRAEAELAASTAEQRSQYESQLAELQLRLTAAEERGQRAISMAQQTKRGHVYIVSNIGSFGGNVYKIGLTRRLDPMDRVYELGDSSVPFDFDVHALIMSDDAPALELKLHKHFIINQINKVNHRKEFFRANLADIRGHIEALGIEATWTMASEAAQFRETLAIERAIDTDPAKREAWLNRQLTLDPVDYLEMAASGTE